MEVRTCTKAGVDLDPLDPADEAALREDPKGDRAQHVLSTLSADGLHLRCACGRRVHPVAATPFRRRTNNRDRDGSGAGCWLCNPGSGSRGASRPGPERIDEFEFPGSGRWGARPRPPRDDRPGDKTKYHPWEHALLFAWIHALQWHRLPGPLAETDLWAQMHQALERTLLPTGRRPHVPARAITWTPACRVDLAAWLTAALADSPFRRPGAWVMGISGHVRQAVGTTVVTLQDLRGRAHWLRIPSRRVSRPRVFRTLISGPYLVMARVSRGPDGAPDYRRLVLLPILERTCPIPVDSHLERRLLRLLQRRCHRFERPLYPNVWDLLPDALLLLNPPIPVEAQGGKFAAYREAKSTPRTLERYAAAQSGTGWALPVLWHANETDPEHAFADFIRQLPPRGDRRPPYPDWTIGLTEMDALCPPPPVPIPMM